ncbi:MAG TPA: hypothetical protein VF730_11015 [Terracidiphilus sp.]
MLFFIADGYGSIFDLPLLDRFAEFQQRPARRYLPFAEGFTSEFAPYNFAVLVILFEKEKS